VRLYSERRGKSKAIAAKNASPTMTPAAISSSLRASWSVIEGDDDTGAPLLLENSLCLPPE
jgi:hypothetical protein